MGEHQTEVIVCGGAGSKISIGGVSITTSIQAWQAVCIVIHPRNEGSQNYLFNKVIYKSLRLKSLLKSLHKETTCEEISHS